MTSPPIPSAGIRKKAMPGPASMERESAVNTYGYWFLVYGYWLGLVFGSRSVSF